MAKRVKLPKNRKQVYKAKATIGVVATSLTEAKKRLPEKKLFGKYVIMKRNKKLKPTPSF